MHTAAKAITLLKITPRLNTTPILAINSKGLIDVFAFDNMDPQVERLGLDQSIRIPLSTLANANMLYRLSLETKIIPGQNVENDEILLNELRQKISPNISNPETVVEEIVSAWNSIAKHDISTPYQAINEKSPVQTLLEPQAAYISAFHDYIYKYLRTLNQLQHIESWVLLQTGELLYSTQAFKPFSTNHYIQLKDLLALANACTNDITASTNLIDSIKQRINRKQELWYTDVKGLVKPEIEDLFNENLEQGEVINALNAILQGDYNDITQEKRILDILEFTLPILKNPRHKLQNLYHRGNPSDEMVREAICSFIIIKLEKIQAAALRKAHERSPAPIPTSELNYLLTLAASENEQQIVELFDLLQNNVSELSKSDLTSIKATTQSELIREAVDALITTHNSATFLPQRNAHNKRTAEELTEDEPRSPKMRCFSDYRFF